MLVKLDKVGTINVHKRAKAKLFKHGAVNKPEVAYSGKNIMKDSHFNSLHNFIFNLVDKVTPMIKKYPKFGKIIVGLGEKILKKSEDFSNKKVM